MPRGTVPTVNNQHHGVMVELWSWVLISVALYKDWMAGSHRRAAWLVGLANQVLWGIYAISTSQIGFMVSVIAYSVIYIRNWRRPPTPPPCPRCTACDARATMVLVPGRGEEAELRASTPLVKL